MNAFTVKFDAFIEKGRKRVLEERNEFRGRLGELSGMSVHICFISLFPFAGRMWINTFANGLRESLLA